jgi:hypothetical protein
MKASALISDGTPHWIAADNLKKAYNITNEGLE